MSSLQELTTEKTLLLQDVQLAEARGDLDKAEIRTSLRRAAELEGQIADMRRQVGDSGGAVIARISQASCLARAGEPSEALEIFERLKDDAQNPDLRRWIDSQMADLRPKILAQVRAAFAEIFPKLPVDQLLRIRQMAEHWAFATGLTAQDLIQDAVLAVIEGRRTWNPAHVDLANLLIGAVRSIAWNERRKRARDVIAPLPHRVEPERVLDWMIEEERLDLVAHSCEDRPDAARLIAYWRSHPDAEREEVREALGVSASEFQSLIRHIRRVEHRLQQSLNP